LKTDDLSPGFVNKVTCFAVANPSPERNGGQKLTTRAAGFGIVKFHKKRREITIECWPRNVYITNPNTKKYPGWPQTIKQEDNYGCKAVAYMPTIEVRGMINPVVQVIEESDARIRLF
jgi:alkaline phosphatase D